ncbi:MAG: biotin--[acetyl-CoA-carboxylase] ligase [Burkholderiales bacterium]|nr:biotin--[acetyl-CoA-carboxylase] ligase [Burkholderiales bacterium]
MDNTIKIQASQILEADHIRALRDAAGRAVDVEVVEETGSTNADLMARLSQLHRPVLRVALHQTAGRGRAGRTWYSVAGGMLTFSLAWRMPQTAHQLMGLPLAVGVAIAEVLNALGVVVKLKWPNDVLKEGKKLAGILIETANAKDGGTWVVAGIGLNLQVPDELETAIGRAVAEAPWLAQMDRNQLMAKLLNALAATFEQFGQGGFAPFLPRWNALHAYAQQPVVILDHGSIIHRGIALGVDTTGCLLLQTDQGQVPVLAGDVSLRPADDSLHV